MLSKHERMELKDERQVKQESVRLVKAEKFADAESERRLAEAYNIKKRSFTDPQGKTWHCPSCGYRDNNEARWICDGCCAIAPFAAASTTGTTPTPAASGSAESTTSKKDVKKIPSESAESARWYAGEEKEVESVVITGASRHYRVYNASVLREKAIRSNRRHKKNATDSDHAVITTPYDRYDGDALPPAAASGAVGGGLPGVVRDVVSGVLDNDDCDDDDEPGCGPRAARRRSHLIGDVDPEGSEDDDVADNLPISYNTTTRDYYMQLPVPALISKAADLRKQLVAALRPIRQASSASVVEIKRDASSGGSDVISIRGVERTSVVTAAQACIDALQVFSCGVEGQGGASCSLPKTTHVDPTQGASAAAAVSMKSDSASASEPKSNVGYTHFISLPLGTIPTVPPFVDALLNEIRQISGLPIVPSATVLPDIVGRGASSAAPSTPPKDHYGLDPTVLQVTAKTHLTILMLSLPTPALVDAAKALMPQVKAAMDTFFKASKGTALHLHTLKPMTPNIEKCNVLYLDIADDDEGGRYALQGLIKSIHKIFLDANLTTPREVEQGTKIHATIVNTKWRKADRQHGAASTRNASSRWQRQIPFNATKLLDVLGQVFLGSHRPTTIELSKLAGEHQPSGYYGAEAVVRFS